MYKIPTFITKNIVNLNKCLEINIGGRKGSTGYIDYLKKEDFTNNYNIVYGYDNATRFFISLLYRKVIDGNENNKFDNYNIMTLFQRYTDDATFFVSCGDTFIHKNNVQTYRFNNMNNNTDNPMPEQFEHFFKLINNKQINISINVNDFYKLDDDYFNQEKILDYEVYYKI